jgi:acyl carrier protein
MRTTGQQALTGIAQIIEEITGVPAGTVTPEKSFGEDLDIDSLSIVEIAVVAQDRFGTEIPDDDLKNLITVRDVMNYVQYGLIGSQHA